MRNQNEEMPGNKIIADENWVSESTIGMWGE
jgi:hypothetical protein